MRSAQRLKTLLLMELLLGVARTLSACFEINRERLRSETVTITMRLLAAKLGSINLDEDFGFRFIFADTALGAASISETTAALKNVEPLLERLLGSHSSPADKTASRLDRAVLLTQLYEQTLDFEVEESSSELNLLEPHQSKKRMGQFYTPLSLARRTVSVAFTQLFSDAKYDSLDAIKNLKILDPAMGGGVFMLCALEFLEKHCKKKGLSASRLTLADCLYGIDLDPHACEVAPLALWLYCVPDTNLQPRPISSFSANFRHADALLSAWSKASHTTESESLLIWDESFPKVFSRSDLTATVPAASSGFDIIVSNPPWELARPNSQEFFARTTPNFRKLTKQEAIIQSEKLLAERTSVKKKWQKEQQDYQTKTAHIRRQAEEQSAAALTTPTFDSDNTDRPRPLFAAQGESDLNVYKLFLGLGFALLKDDGAMAMVVPSGVLADKGAYALRRLFLKQGRLFSVETFVNSDRLFPIHPSFAYSVIGVQKDGETKTIRVKFDQQSNLQFSYKQKDISILSPRWLTIFDVSHPKDLEILKKLHSNGVALGDSIDSDEHKWNLKFKREFDMTNDSGLFRTVAQAEREGYRCDIFGNWLKGSWEGDSASYITPSAVPSYDLRSLLKVENIEDVLLPLYEGRMIGQFDYSQKCHLSGSGRTAVWQSNHDIYGEKSKKTGSSISEGYTEDAGQTAMSVSIEHEGLIHLLMEQSKPIRSHYLVHPDAKAGSPLEAKLKTGYLAVGSATNVRTMLASALFMVPCGNSVPVLSSKDGITSPLTLTACLNSFVFDYALRMRMTGNNLNYFLLQECPLPQPELIFKVPEILALVAALNLNHVRNAAQWLELSNLQLNSKADRLEAGYASINKQLHLFATSRLERLHMRSMLDALVAKAFELSFEEYAWIMRGCDRQLSRDQSLDSLPHAKGFWRDGKSSQPSMRLPVLALEAYGTLLNEGSGVFLKKTNHFKHGLMDDNDKKGLQALACNLQEVFQQYQTLKR